MCLFGSLATVFVFLREIMKSIWVFSSSIFFIFYFFCFKLNVHIACPLTDRSRVWQASLKAEDILNLWPDAELGRILRDYGEESNWFSLQKKIVKARITGGLHSTRELVDLIRSSTSWTRGSFPFSSSFIFILLDNIDLCHLGRSIRSIVLFI